MANSAFSALITATGTASQIGVTAGLYPVYTIANNPIFPGSAGATLPSGNTAARAGNAGTIRFNSQTTVFEGTVDGINWVTIAGAAGPILSITGTAGQIDVTAGNNPVISIDAGYVGQVSITTLGTITTGVWHGTPIGVIYGGTGLNATTINQILYSSANNTIAGLATANSGVLITSAGGVPSIGSTLPTAVQTNITELGTITVGTWNGSLIPGTYGGTGVNNGASTITVGGNTAFSGAFTFTGTLTGNTAVTFPTAGTLATTSQLPTLPLSLANGGTNAALVASNGGIVWSNATQMQILAGTATASQVLLSGSTATPAWSIATYPATTTINQVLYSSSNNVITGLATANNGVHVTGNTGIPSVLAGPGTTGQILQSNAAAAPSFSTASYPSTTTINQILYSSAANVVGGITATANGTLITGAAGIPSIAALANGTILIGTAGAPAASTATYPATTTINQLLYSSAANTIGGLATANSATLVTGSTGIPVMSGTMTNGQVIIGSTGATPSAATLTALANSGVAITNGAASISIGTNGVLKSFQVLTSGTAATYTKPAGINNILVECIGGGGAGGGSASSGAGVAVGAGGGAGGYCRKLITGAAGTYTYTIGAGGTPGSAGNNPGGNGAATTFSGGTLSAGGGTGGGGDAGSAASHTTPAGFPNGGTSSGGDINVTGQGGKFGFTSLVAYGYSGEGGSTIYGPGALGYPSSSAATAGNSAAANTGAGGGGAISANTATAEQGGAGGSGLIIVWEFV